MLKPRRQTEQSEWPFLSPTLHSSLEGMPESTVHHLVTRSGLIEDIHARGYQNPLKHSGVLAFFEKGTWWGQASFWRPHPKKNFCALNVYRYRDEIMAIFRAYFNVQ